MDTNQSEAVASNAELGIVERLRAEAEKFGFPSADRALHIEAAEEIDRLRAALVRANNQTERFERGWYLRGDALQKLHDWADAYPLTVFPEPDFAKAHQPLQAGGMTLDAISASNMRHVIDNVREIVAEGLRA